MMKFFRKIRQKLLSKNKFIKYLLYAIGEIALVVIGILIALQVNNSNEQKKDRKKEQVFLQKIKSNLQSDIVSYQKAIDANQTFQKNLDTLEMILEEKLPANQALFMTNQQGIIRFRIFTVNKTAFDNLQSSGQLDIIANDSLLESILSYYQLTERISYGTHNPLRIFTENLINYWMEKFDSRSFHSSINTLKQEAFMGNSIKFKNNLFTAQIDRYKDQIDDANSIIGLIEKELKQ